MVSKIGTVKGYVKAMQDMIKKSKETELQQAAEKRVYREVERDIAPPMPMTFAATPSASSARGGGGGGSRGGFVGGRPGAAPSAVVAAAAVSTPTTTTPAKPDAPQVEVSKDDRLAAASGGHADEGRDYTKVPPPSNYSFYNLSVNSSEDGSLRQVQPNLGLDLTSGPHTCSDPRRDGAHL